MDDTNSKPAPGDVLAGTYYGHDFIGRVSQVSSCGWYSIELDGEIVISGIARTSLGIHTREIDACTVVQRAGLAASCSDGGFWTIDMEAA